MDFHSRLLAVARGQLPADLVLRNGRIVNVFTGTIEQADIAIVGDRIAGIGPGYQAEQTVDLRNSFVAPGYIDAHVHIESSLCTPGEFARAVVPRGVTAVVTDPHELANVAGTRGVEYIYAASRGLPLEVIVMAPSCVPATHMGTSGAALTADDLAQLRSAGIVHGLAEVMNFPGVIHDDQTIRDKFKAMPDSPVDGHCPGVVGHSLNAYVAAGVGSDHESTTVEEAREKLARGLYLLIRQATNARNLDTLLPVITPANARRICFCTDDRTPGDLLREGSVDHMVRRAIEFGIDPIDAIRMATLNPSEWFRLPHLGAIAPGRVANLIVFDDLQRPEARFVYSRGRHVATDGTLVVDTQSNSVEHAQLGRCVVDWNSVDLRMKARTTRINVMIHQPDQLLTGRSVMDANVHNGHAVSDVARDLLKMVVIERHRGTGEFAVGFMQGFGLRRGAIAGTIAHDHHNLVIIGVDDESVRLAGQAVTRMNGGLCVVDEGRVVAELALPIGGLMSDLPVHDVARSYDRLVEAARSLGSPLTDPFMAMSFMALEVIPSLKLTDQGLVDVERFQLIDLFV